MQVFQLIRIANLHVPAKTTLINDREAIIDAVNQLEGQIHERMAYIGGSTTLSSGAARLSAFGPG